MKKKLLFVNDEMCMGGVSKVLINLFNNIDKDKYEIDLLVLHPHGEMINKIPNFINVIKGTSFFDVCDIPVKECFKHGKFLKKLTFYNKLKSGSIIEDIKKEREKMSLEKYDVEIAFKEGICSVFTSCSNANTKINWIHADYGVKNYAANYMNTMKKILKKFDYHVAVSNVAAESFKDIFELNEVKTIHNIIDTDKIINNADEKVSFRDDIFSFVCVGRLHPQKGYDRLLEVCDSLNRQGNKYKIYILGDGEEKNNLIKLKEEKMLNNVFFLGNKDNPYPYIKQADCLLLCSIYEGLPTVVYESLILHTPVLTTRVAGVDEQLKDKYGLIVENDAEHLRKGMLNFICDKAILNDYKKNLFNYEYDNEKILNEIYTLFDKR